LALNWVTRAIAVSKVQTVAWSQAHVGDWRIDAGVSPRPGKFMWTITQTHDRLAPTATGDDDCETLEAAQADAEVAAANALMTEAVRIFQVHTVEIKVVEP
jgi:hypothetical protein